MGLFTFIKIKGDSFLDQYHFIMSAFRAFHEMGALPFLKGLRVSVVFFKYVDIHISTVIISIIHEFPFILKFTAAFRAIHMNFS